MHAFASVREHWRRELFYLFHWQISVVTQRNATQRNGERHRAASLLIDKYYEFRGEERNANSSKGRKERRAKKKKYDKDKKQQIRANETPVAIDSELSVKYIHVLYVFSASQNHRHSFHD